MHAYRGLVVLAELLARDGLDELEQQYAVFQLGSQVVHLQADLGELQVDPRSEGLELHPLGRLRRATGQANRLGSGFRSGLVSGLGQTMSGLGLTIDPAVWFGSGLGLGLCAPAALVGVFRPAPPDWNRPCRLQAHRPSVP